MRSLLAALFALVLVPALSWAQTLVVGNAAGLPGSSASPLPVSITLTNGTTAATAIRDIDARLTYDPAVLTIVAAGNAPGACTVLSPGNILVAAPDNGATPLADGVICNLTAISIAPGAVSGSTPLTLANGAGSGCTVASGEKVLCGYVSGAVTVLGGPTLVVGSASGLPGANAAPVPVAITLTNSTTPATAIRDIDARLTYDPAVLTIVAAGNAPGSCMVLSPGTILVSDPDNGATPLADGVICNLTAITISAGATPGSTPLTLANGAGSGCTNAAGDQIPCGYVSGAVTVGTVVPASLVVGSASGLPGGPATPVPVTITLTNGTAAAAVRDIDARLTYDPAVLSVVAAGNAPGVCVELSPGNILVTSPDNGAPLADGVICELTAIAISASAPLGATPLTIASGAGSGCTGAAGTTVPCGFVSGAVTVLGGSTLSVSSASGFPGTSASPVPVAIRLTNGTTAATAIRDIDARLTYDPAILTIVPAGNPPGSCMVLSPGNILVSNPDNGATPLANGVICNLTAIAINAGAVAGATPLTLASGAGSGCTNAAGATIPCGYVSGAVTVLGGASVVVGSAAGLPGTAASPMPVSITLTNGTTAGTAVRDLDARLTYDPEMLTIVAAGNPPGNCSVLSPGNILVANPDNGATPLANGVICNLTAIAISPNAPLGTTPLTISDGAGSGCTSASGTAIPCGYVSGSVTVAVSLVTYIVPPATLTFPTTNPGANTSLNVPVAASGGNTAALQLSQCTIAGTHATDFSVTAPVGATTVAAGTTTNVVVRFAPVGPSPLSRSATLTCPTPNATAPNASSFSVALTGPVTPAPGSTLVVGNATGPVGGSASPLPITITLTNGTTAETAVRDIDSRLTYNPAILTVVAAGNGPGSCTVLAPGNILVSAPDNGAPLPNGVICNLTAVGISADAPLGATPLTLANGAGSGCTSAAGGKIPCGYVSGNVTVTPAVNYTIPPTTLTFPTTDAGANTSLNVPVAASAGNSAALQLSQCTIAGTHATDFSVTAPVGATTVAAGTTTNVVVRFAPVGASPSSRTATLTCPTPNATAPNATFFSVALTGPVTNAALIENFDIVPGPVGSPLCTLSAQLAATGWFARNNAIPVGTTCVFQGGGVGFPSAQSGAASSYAAMDFNSAAGVGDISTWFITPRLAFGSGAKLEFWTRGIAGATHADSMQVRLSTAPEAGLPDVGTTTNSVGTFTTLLVNINPMLATASANCTSAGLAITSPNSVITGYPLNDWCKITISGEALPSSGSGRIAFRYNPAQGGPAGINSNFIGIDTLVYLGTGPLPDGVFSNGFE